MKNVFIMAALLLMVSACNDKKDKEADKKVMYSDLVADNLKGDVSSYEETPYKTDSTGNAGEMDSCCIEVTEYDENGYSTQWTSKDSKGNVKETSVFARHPNGLWKSATNTKDGKPSGTFETVLDDKGLYSTAHATDSTGKLDIYYTNITQNDMGMVLSWKQYDKDSVFRQEGAGTYDKTMQTGFTVKDSVGTVKSTSTFKYNDKGERTEVSNTNITKDTTTTKVTKFTYESHDETGNWTQRTAWDDKGKATKIVKRTYVYRNKEEK